MCFVVLDCIVLSRCLCYFVHHLYYIRMIQSGSVGGRTICFSFPCCYNSTSTLHLSVHKEKNTLSHRGVRKLFSARRHANLYIAWVFVRVFIAPITCAKNIQSKSWQTQSQVIAVWGRGLKISISCNAEFCRKMEGGCRRHFQCGQRFLVKMTYDQKALNEQECPALTNISTVHNL